MVKYEVLICVECTGEQKHVTFTVEDDYAIKYDTLSSVPMNDDCKWADYCQTMEYFYQRIDDVALCDYYTITKPRRMEE